MDAGRGAAETDELVELIRHGFVSSWRKLDRPLVLG
jgi:hypothetical protein